MNDLPKVQLGGDGSARYQNLWSQDEGSQQDIGTCLSGGAHSSNKNMFLALEGGEPFGFCSL